MVALAKGSQSINIVDKAEAVPEGCSTDTVGADIVVNLLIKVSRPPIPGGHSHVAEYLFCAGSCQH